MTLDKITMRTTGEAAGQNMLVPDFSIISLRLLGQNMLNLASGQATNCYSWKTAYWRPVWCWLGEGPWALVAPVKMSFKVPNNTCCSDQCCPDKCRSGKCRSDKCFRANDADPSQFSNDPSSPFVAQRRRRRRRRRWRHHHFPIDRMCMRARMSSGSDTGGALFC